MVSPISSASTNMREEILKGQGMVKSEFGTRLDEVKDKISTFKNMFLSS
jgi:hypothetical protein